MSTSLGMIGTGDWAQNQDPENWRQGILMLYPNGQAPLTAIMSMMGKGGKINSTVHHWWTKTLARQGGAVTNMYTDSALSSAYSYSSPAASGTVLYAKCAQAVAEQIRVGQQILLRDASDAMVDVNGDAVAVVTNGANSYVAVKLLEAERGGSYGTAPSGTSGIETVDTILVIGNFNEQGATPPDALNFKPVEYSNRTQIFADTVDITRTAMKTSLRTGDPLKEARREALEYHSIGMEKAMMFGVQSSGVGPNNKPRTTMDGILSQIYKEYGTNGTDLMSDFSVDSAFSGKNWTDIDGGEYWLDLQLEKLFNYGETEKLGLCGAGALTAINRLAKLSGEITLVPNDIGYGSKVQTWVTPHGVLHLKKHPLFVNETTNYYSILAVQPSSLHDLYIDDTFLKPLPDNKDGKVEEYITEMTLQLDHPQHHRYLNGVGKDNTV